MEKKFLKSVNPDERERSQAQSLGTRCPCPWGTGLAGWLGVWGSCCLPGGGSLPSIPLPLDELFPFTYLTDSPLKPF